MSRKSHLKTATIICLLCLLLGSTQSKPESEWTPEMTAAFRARSQQAITNFAGSNYGSTAFENEKRSYPRAMMDFLAGNREKAIAFLQSEDADLFR
ncbi:hypothetical protein LC653_14585 [Nostoc sp. CHAB 5784]|uniref:hypothetical protein n=1 Tax=Nostoc mirabile TaxID=2907820 RepID=UPI001E380D9F|nr:hypothetical protein [Nostoc mirabile]MCC5665109.1 hypothetical protein [Nostoc mirabile CHAB5784]